MPKKRGPKLELPEWPVPKPPKPPSFPKPTPPWDKIQVPDPFKWLKLGKWK